MNKIRPICGLLWVFLTIYSCVPPGEIPDDPRQFSGSTHNIIAVSKTLPYFRIYLEAAKTAHIDYILEGDGPLTVFMPNINAFNKFCKENYITDFNVLSEERRKEILLYHIIPGTYRAADIPNGYYPTYTLEKTTQNPVDLYINTSVLLQLNGDACLDEPDLPATNGLVHSITSVKHPPDVVEHISYSPVFTMFYSILSRQDLGQNYIQLLKSEGPFTILVPDDDAFVSLFAGHPDWETYLDISSEIANRIIMRHISTGENILFDPVDDVREFHAADSSLLIFQVTPLQKTVMDEQGITANVMVTDIQGYNGVIQQIDRVLLTD